MVLLTDVLVSVFVQERNSASSEFKSFCSFVVVIARIPKEWETDIGLFTFGGGGIGLEVVADGGTTI